MRCSAYCSGAGEPTPGKTALQSWRRGAEKAGWMQWGSTIPTCTAAGPPRHKGAAASLRWQNSLCLDGHNQLSAGAQYGCSVTLLRGALIVQSHRLNALLGLLLRRWPANAGKSCPAILAECRRKGRLDAMGLTIPPAWLCHAVPPLHKGGCGVPPPSYCAPALGNRAKAGCVLGFS